MPVTERCKTHPDEIYTFYCRSHDMVYCPVCTVEDHGECFDIYFLSDAPSVGEKDEVTLLDKFSDIIAAIEKRKEPIEKEFKSFIDKKNTFINTLTDFREELVSKLDVLIAKAKDDVHDAFQYVEDLLNEDLEKMSIIQTAVDCARTRSNLTADKTKEQTIVDLKLGYHRLAAVQDMVNNMKLSDVKKVAPDLSIDKDVIHFNQGDLLKRSEDINESYVDISITVQSIAEVDVGIPDSLMSSDITGTCSLQDKSFLLCDHNNKHIHRLIDNKCVTFPVTFNPFDACVISNDEIALTAPRQEQIVVFSTNDFGKLRCFQTDKPCKGIDSNREHIFAASSSWLDTALGCVYEFNKYGEVIREFGLNWQSSVVLSPVRLCLDTINKCIPLFTDPKYGVFRLGADGKLTHLLDEMDVSGLCVTDKGHILTCRVQSNSVCAISESGDVISTFEIPKAQWPVSMAYDNEASTVVIGSLNSKNVSLVGIKCVLDTDS